jgi:hypothetical protein
MNNSKNLPVLLFAVLAFFAAIQPAVASEFITATITITNVPNTGSNITIKASTRYWGTNQTSVNILTNLASVNKSATNLFNQIAGNAVLGVIPGWSATNAIVLRGVDLTVSVSTNWATLTLSTNAGPELYSVMVPFPNLSATNRTNTANFLVDGLNTNATVTFNTNAALLANYVHTGNGAAQRVTHQVAFDSLSGTNSGLTNGVYYNGTNVNPVNTNLINYGNAIRSEGSGGNSLQVGSNAVAMGLRSVALGADAMATNIDSVAIGTGSISTNQYSMAIGNSARAANSEAMAVGRNAVAAGNSSLAFGSGALAQDFGDLTLGAGAEATGGENVTLGTSATINTSSNCVAIGSSASITSLTNSVALGSGSTATANNQVRLGTSAEIVSIPGRLAAATSTNTTMTGTNKANVLAFTRYAISTLANGNNAAVPIKTNTFCEVSGPTGIFTVNGVDATGVMDGQLLILLNQTTFAMTVAHDSGTDPTAANRIYSMSGADRATTGNGAALLIYNASVSRWILLHLDP